MIQDSLKNKKHVIAYCKIGHGKGKFGRILGEIFVPEGFGDVSINKQMCDEGYAVEYYGGNKDSLEAQHQVNKEKLIAKGILSV